MKRGDLLRHLRENGCELLREGARHSGFLLRKLGLNLTLRCLTLFGHEESLMETLAYQEIESKSL